MAAHHRPEKRVAAVNRETHSRRPTRHDRPSRHNGTAGARTETHSNTQDRVAGDRRETRNNSPSPQPLQSSRQERGTRSNGANRQEPRSNRAGRRNRQADTAGQHGPDTRRTTMVKMAQHETDGSRTAATQVRIHSEGRNLREDRAANGRTTSERRRQPRRTDWTPQVQVHHTWATETWIPRK